MRWNLTANGSPPPYQLVETAFRASEVPNHGPKFSGWIRADGYLADDGTWLALFERYVIMPMPPHYWRPQQDVPAND